MQFGGDRYDARISGRNATRAKVYDAQDIVVSWQLHLENELLPTKTLIIKKDCRCFLLYGVSRSLNSCFTGSIRMTESPMLAETY